MALKIPKPPAVCERHYEVNLVGSTYYSAWMTARSVGELLTNIRKTFPSGFAVTVVRVEDELTAANQRIAELEQLVIDRHALHQAQLHHQAREFGKQYDRAIERNI